MNKEYWENYYQTMPEPTNPSRFAQYVLKNFVKTNDKLVEIGCGNGRDSIYFANNGVDVLAIDQCESIRQIINNYNKANLKKVHYHCADFTKINLKDKFDGIYSRFTLHAIKEHEEDRVLKWASQSLNDKGKFYVEARSIKNELYKKGVLSLNEPNTYTFNNHQRRFIEKRNFCKKLIKLGFKILVEVEDKTFAPTDVDDQIFMRVIAEKAI